MAKKLSPRDQQIRKYEKILANKTLQKYCEQIRPEGNWTSLLSNIKKNCTKAYYFKELRNIVWNLKVRLLTGISWGDYTKKENEMLLNLLRPLKFTHWNTKELSKPLSEKEKERITKRIDRERAKYT